MKRQHACKSILSPLIFLSSNKCTPIRMQIFIQLRGPQLPPCNCKCKKAVTITSGVNVLELPLIELGVVFFVLRIYTGRPLTGLPSPPPPPVMVYRLCAACSHFTTRRHVRKGRDAGAATKANQTLGLLAMRLGLLLWVPLRENNTCHSSARGRVPPELC